MSIGGNILSGVKAHRIASKAALPIDRRGAAQGGRAVGRRFQPAQLIALQPVRGTAAAPLPRAVPSQSGPRSCCWTNRPLRLDPITTENIEAMIRSLAPAVTIIIVTHNLGQARRISDRTIFFYQGKLVEFDETAKLFEDPKEPETARYVTGRMG